MTKEADMSRGSNLIRISRSGWLSLAAILGAYLGLVVLLTLVDLLAQYLGHSLASEKTRSFEYFPSLMLIASFGWVVLLPAWLVVAWPFVVFCHRRAPELLVFPQSILTGLAVAYAPYVILTLLFDRSGSFGGFYFWQMHGFSLLLGPLWVSAYAYFVRGRANRLQQPSG